MAIDWITALGAQDNSLESLMAKQDLSKKIALMDTLARTKQAADIAKQNREERAREFDIRNKELEETRKEREQRYSESKAQREMTERRNKYNTVVDNYRSMVGRGITPKFDKATADLIREQEGAGAVEPDIQPGQTPDTATQYLYRKHEAEAAALALKQQQEKEQHNQALADKRFALEQERAAREKADAAERQKTRELQNKAIQARLDKASDIEKNLSPAGKAEASQAAKARLDAMTKEGSLFFGKSPEEVQAMRSQVVHDEYDRVRQKEEAVKGKPPGPRDLVNGRGGGPGAGGPQNEEATKALAAKLGIPYRPGMKIEPVK